MTDGSPLWESLALGAQATAWWSTPLVANLPGHERARDSRPLVQVSRYRLVHRMGEGMTRVTEYFSLDMTQGSVDFVDVDVVEDVPVYIDPTALRNQPGEWARSCVESLQSFFEALLKAIGDDDLARLRDLIYPLVEPNETHLGVSKGRSRGRSLGSREKAEELIDSLRGSRAAATGMLRDLEDSALMVPGIDKDIISDVTTCVIRRYLIDYTQQQCEFHEIEMELQDSRPMWNGSTGGWDSEDVPLPRAADNTLLLVPKSIVRARLTMNKGKYYRGYLRPYFEEEALQNPRVGLVRILKDGALKVVLGALDGELGTTKPDIIRNTEKYPQALEEYKNSVARDDQGPISEADLAARVGAEVESLRDILEEIRAISAGKAGATLYHRSIARFLSALFGQVLGNQRFEKPLHGDLKRIDIVYDNVARTGFFFWLVSHFASSTIPVECKNYGKDAANPEFDQLAMRFSAGRGQVGILACRAFADKQRALDRARAIRVDGHGYVIVLDDDDLERLIDDVESAGTDVEQRLRFPLLRERFDDLVGG